MLSRTVTLNLHIHLAQPSPMTNPHPSVQIVFQSSINNGNSRFPSSLTSRTNQQTRVRQSIQMELRVRLCVHIRHGIGANDAFDQKDDLLAL